VSFFISIFILFSDWMSSDELDTGVLVFSVNTATILGEREADTVLV
jgi:hypothetical protein